MTQRKAPTLAVNAVANGGYTGTDTLSCRGLPAGVTVSLPPATLTNGAGASTLTLTAAGNVMTGAFNIGVQATDGMLTVSAPVMPQVNLRTSVIYNVIASVDDSCYVPVTKYGSTEWATPAAVRAVLGLQPPSPA